MPDADLQAVLRQRLLAAAADHPHLQAILYIGRHEALPQQLRSGSGTEVTWPLAQLRGLPPVHVHIATFAEPQPGYVEVLAFFGDEVAMDTLARLSKAAIDATDGWQAPAGHSLSTSAFAAAAWTRALFAREQEVRRHFVSWHASEPKAIAVGDFRASAFDPLTEPNMALLEARGHGPFGAVAVQFTSSVFAVSAATIGQPALGYLGLDVRVVERHVVRCDQFVDLSKTNQCWLLFYHLWEAKERGCARSALMHLLWPHKAVTDNALDQVKGKLDDLLGQLGLEVIADNRGVWRLGVLALSGMGPVGL